QARKLFVWEVDGALRSAQLEASQQAKSELWRRCSFHSFALAIRTSPRCVGARVRPESDAALPVRPILSASQHGGRERTCQVFRKGMQKMSSRCRGGWPAC